MTAGARVDEAVMLFGHWICPFSVRVEFALAQLDVPYEAVDVPPTVARPKGYVVPDEFLAHSPRREIPMIRAGGRYLVDSLPILEWLFRGPGGPDDAALERARWVDRRVFAPMIAVSYGTDPEAISRAAARLGHAFDDLARLLAPSGWLAGDGPSIAEAALVPMYVRLEGLRALGFGRALPEPVGDHLLRCLALPGGEVVRWNDAQHDEFVWRFRTYRERAAARAAS
jgi:glutathione S-transferase